MYIPRTLEKTLLKYLNKKEVIAVMGPRQCGKTTLLNRIFKNLKNAVFIDFEDREKLELFMTDISSFIELYVKPNKYLFIDEFQYASDGGKSLKFIYDNYNIKIFISGSSATGLTIKSIKYLVGRIFVFNLFPFSFEEFLSYKGKEIYEKIYTKGNLSKIIIKHIYGLYKEYAAYGGYPRVVIAHNKEEKEIVLKNIYNTYFLKEIKEILGLTADFKLSKLIKVLSLQIGGLINYNELSSLTGFSHYELLRHLNILEKTFICKMSRPYYTNKRIELTKNPKIYFFDNGFRNIVISSFQELDKRIDKGILNENFIASEIIKKELELRYWRSKSKAEVDFVIIKNNEVYPLEVKSLLLSEKVTRSFMSFIEKYRPKKGFVAADQFTGKRKEKGCAIDFIPVFYISQILDKL